MSHEGNTKYKEGEGGFEPVTYRSQHLNLSHLKNLNIKTIEITELTLKEP